MSTLLHSDLHLLSVQTSTCAQTFLAFFLAFFSVFLASCSAFHSSVQRLFAARIAVAPVTPKRAAALDCSENSSLEDVPAGLVVSPAAQCNGSNNHITVM